MSEVTVDRKFTRDSLESLRVALLDVVGSKLIRLTLAKGIPTVGLSADATAEDENAVTQILLAHDISKRTPEQETQAESKGKLEAARAKVESGKATKDELIDYLLLEVQYLRASTGL